ncbi:MAG: DUF6913 domain-containing protein [Saprospiraceae bacterium]
MLDYLLKQKLRRLANNPTRKRQTHSLRTARSLALVFDATENQYRQEVLNWAREQEKSGKSIQLLGYFDARQPPEDPGFPFFSKKNRSLNGSWKNTPLDAFADFAPDLLIVLNPKDRLPLIYAAVRSNAAMKVGAPSEWTNDFDLLLETPGHKNLSFFLDQLHFYLEKLHTAHEPARTI